MSERWYVVHTQPHAEHKALVHLQRQGFTAYMPRYSKRRRHARRVEQVSAPLFPRYLFVALDLETCPWRPIRSTVGVAALVCCGDAPLPVPEGVVEEIRARENELGMVELRPLLNVRRGEPIRIIDGAFCDYLGLFEEITEDRRVGILLNLLGRPVRVYLPEGFVSAAA